MKELITIQSTLKAPKSQFNAFGNYKYRKVEDILEAVKPIMSNLGCTLVMTDDIEMVGNRIYVKATATLKNSKGEIEITTGYAREEETKKGMDGSQITGAASSYARKYALNGLFAIDDNADSDTTNIENQQSQQKVKSSNHAPVASDPQYHPNDINEAIQMVSRCVNKDNLVWVMQTYQPLMSNAQFMQTLSAKRKELGI
jgi:hypothetical protein|nr:MAG TPA: ERF superfamily protein [Caudoviricetes sp.]